MSNIYNYLLIGLSIILTVIVTDFISNKKRRVFYLILLGLAGFALNWYKDYRSELSQKEEKRASDSLNRMQIKEAIATQTLAFGKAVGEYGIELKKSIDSNSKNIYTLVRNSNKKAIINVAEISEDPYLGFYFKDSSFSPIQFVKGKPGADTLFIEIFTDYAAATDIDVKIVLMYSPLQFIGTKLIPIYPKGYQTWKGLHSKRYLIINPAIRENTIYAFMFGTYKDPLKKNEYPVNQFLSLDMKSNTLNHFLITEQQQVIKKLAVEHKEIKDFLVSHKLEN